MLSDTYQGPTQMADCSEVVQSDQCGPVNQKNARYHIQVSGKETTVTCFDKYISSSGTALCQGKTTYK